MARAPLEMESMGHTVRIAKVPENSGLRKELIAMLKSEIADAERESPADAKLPLLRQWLAELQAIC